MSSRRELTPTSFPKSASRAVPARNEGNFFPESADLEPHSAEFRASNSTERWPEVSRDFLESAKPEAIPSGAGQSSTKPGPNRAESGEIRPKLAASKRTWPKWSYFRPDSQRWPSPKQVSTKRPEDCGDFEPTLADIEPNSVSFALRSAETKPSLSIPGASLLPGPIRGLLGAALGSTWGLDLGARFGGSIWGSSRGLDLGARFVWSMCGRFGFSQWTSWVRRPAPWQPRAHFVPTEAPPPRRRHGAASCLPKRP